MDLALTEEQEQLVASFSNLLAKGSSAEQVRAAEPLGFDAELWSSLVDTGAIVMAAPEAAGGWGAGLLDLALVAETLGRAAASAPVIEAQVAARLLARVDHDLAPSLVADGLAGSRLVTFAPAAVSAGTAGLVPAGAVCDAAVVHAPGALMVVAPEGDGRRRVANLASAPLADIDVARGAVELASGEAAAGLVEGALDEWLVLTASAVVGLATTAHELGCEYARERRAFGRPIGAFQAISHPLADDATNLDGARLLVHKAAWASDVGDPRARELAAMAFAFACTSAETATYNALHTHGGYGFMLEYDVQLHYRRARGWPRVWGDSERAYRRAAATRYESEAS